MRKPLKPALDLREDIDRCGYYPQLVWETLDLVIAGESVAAHLLQPETTFDSDEVRRHLTALILTPSRFVVAHVDDHAPAGPGQAASATSSTEAVPLTEVRSVVVTQGFSDPAQSERTALRELTISVGWGAVQRLDLEPATCGDPKCEADHGYTGAVTSDDLVIRVAADAEGDAALAAARAFAAALSAATARTSGSTR